MTKRAAPPGEQPTLLEHAAERGALSGASAPLADRMRPRAVEEILGQGHLLGDGRLLSDAILHDRVPSMILWGPPGSGKTTLARIVSHTTRS